MDRLLEKDISATQFDLEARTRPLPSRAETVVVGGGIIGSSIAYHLALLGHRDVLVLERSSIASGTSWHAAGLIAGARGSHALTKLSRYGVDVYSRMQAETGVDINLRQPGSITLCRTQGRMDEVRYSDMVARHAGIPSELVTPKQITELHGLASKDKLLGGMFHPLDGHVNPGMAALAFAKGAFEQGVTIREGVSVTGIRTVHGRVTHVETDLGVVETQNVVLAAGLWTRDLAEMCGANVPLWPAAHIHVRTAPIAGAEEPLPVLRDLDGYLYIRQNAGGLLVGAFEPNGKPVDPKTLPQSFSFGEFDADWDHFAQIRTLAEGRVPALRKSKYERFLNAPESFTPDSNFCLGETAEVNGLWVAAGFNSQGIIYAPGAGRALAEWMVSGSPTYDLASVDVQRFAGQQANRRYLNERTREGLGRLYAMHWPHLQPTTARGVRRTPLHDRLDQAGAVFGELVGYERANWFAPKGVAREYQYSYGKQNWFDHSAREHRAAREAVAVFDLSTFSKIEIHGWDALQVVQHSCTANVDVPIGKVVYTLMLNKAGGIELDGTVTRLDKDRFLIVTPTSALTKTLALFKRAARTFAASVVDQSSTLATIAVMGPRSRELMQRISPDDFSNEAQPWGTARMIQVADGYALCLRVSFVGELGYELYPTNDLAVNVYDAVIDAGKDLGIVRAGYHALDSLRVEKGYRHLGHDIGAIDDPYSASLGFTVAIDKPGGFTGRDAILDKQNKRTHRQVFIKLDNPDLLFVHDESVLRDGQIVGHVTSGAYGHTVGAACGVAYIKAHLPSDGDYIVDCAGQLSTAVVSDQAFYDPTNGKLRG
ncbi:MAG: FAD-dependent oxidoreductase [Actinomycetes bacterium]